MISVDLKSEVNELKRNQIEELSDRGLLPDCDYSSFKSFLKTINNDDLGEIVNLCENTQDKNKAEYLSYIVGMVFMNEYDTDTFRNIDFSNMLMQFYRQCIAEACERVGVWDASKEDKRLIPNDAPF